MSSTDPIAYVYEADHHCESCTEARFGRSESGFVAEGATDSEGNEVGALFSWDEWYANDVYEGNPRAVLACGTCGEIIEEIDLGPSESILSTARESGAEHGRNAASWYFDGNTTDETYRAVLAGIDEGDPMVLDTFPSSPLSGEWSGDPTPSSVLEDLGIDDDDDSADEYLDAYEDAFHDAAQSEIERVARLMVLS
jgi:hypothetical protein